MNALRPIEQPLHGEAERRGNRWAFLCGYWLGKGFTYDEAAERVPETHPKTIQGIARRAGILEPRQLGQSFDYTIRLTTYERAQLTARALEEGIEPEEWLRRVAACAVTDGLYAAVTDGRYQQFNPLLSSLL